jgi:hypothetical protein
MTFVTARGLRARRPGVCQALRCFRCRPCFRHIHRKRHSAPSLLKQDPRYFYKGTGRRPSRIRYALATAVICKGDNGHWQANYSNILGSLAAGGISNLYYRAENRHGAGLTFENGLIGMAQPQLPISCRNSSSGNSHPAFPGKVPLNPRWAATSKTQPHLPNLAISFGKQPPAK